jgi:hypothetical protein
MRWAPQKRQEFITCRVMEVGRLNRRDIMEEFRVSMFQASLDIREWIKRNPGKIGYDMNRKAYFRL